MREQGDQSRILIHARICPRIAQDRQGYQGGPNAGDRCTGIIRFGSAAKHTHPMWLIAAPRAAGYVGYCFDRASNSPLPACASRSAAAGSVSVVTVASLE